MYTIRLNSGTEISQGVVHMLLEDRLAKSPFRATLKRTMDNKGNYCIFVKPVRLRKAKPYCGAHYGECIINSFLGPQKKKIATYLEFEDWVKFHKVVNAVLNKARVDADVWSIPLETRGKFWIRKGRKARKKFDVAETYDGSGRRIQTWNLGDDSQF